MQVVTSYKVKIMEYNEIFNETLEIYRETLKYIIDVVNTEWEMVKNIKGNLRKMMCVERLIHTTSNNIAKYNFDKQFNKLPSYLRRGAIREAIGKVETYKKNYDNFEKSKQKAPRLQVNHYTYPALFKDNMYIRIDDYTSKIKIYKDNDWKWLIVKLKKSDVDYILRNKKNAKETVPTLEKKGYNWYLRFAFIDEVELVDDVKVITSVDLGINNAATCSAILPDGTVIGRKIISIPVEKDQMEHKLNKIKKAQKKGARRPKRLWTYVNNYNQALAEKTAQAIMEFALQYESDVIVFEYLDTKGKKKGSKKQRLHMWKKQAVIQIVTTKAHLQGMRISRICAWNTSKLAYDGSGEVIRDGNNYSMCTFITGKKYHTDLSASYNIGARYYIREILKTLPEKVRLGVEAKVPRLTKRTTCVLSDLISLNAELMAIA